MKKFIAFIFCGITFACIANAESININWIVDGETHTTTTCNIGDNLILPTAPTKYGYTFQGWVTYTPIEYLESTGRQWIDTGISGFDTGNWEIYAKWMLPVATQSYNYPAVFSVYQGEQYNTYRVIVAGTDSKSCILYGNNKAASGGQIIENQSINQIHTAVVKDNIVTFDDQTYTTNVKGNTLPNGAKLSIFMTYGSNGGIIAKIYSVKVKKNGVLFADFIPVLDQHGVPCMYDKVTQQFFYNSGTGDFIAGPVIGE